MYIFDSHFFSLKLKGLPKIFGDDHMKQDLMKQKEVLFIFIDIVMKPGVAEVQKLLGGQG